MWNVFRKPLTSEDLKVVLGYGLAGAIILPSIIAVTAPQWQWGELLGAALVAFPAGLWGGVVYLLLQTSRCRSKRVKEEDKVCGDKTGLE